MVCPDYFTTKHHCLALLMGNNFFFFLSFFSFYAAEYEFYQFRAPSNSNGLERNSSSTATFLKDNPVNALPPLTEGMFGYSLIRPVHNQDYYYSVFNTCRSFDCDIESWHTESGPGVFEAVSISSSSFGPLIYTLMLSIGFAIRRNQRDSRSSWFVQVSVLY